MTPAISILLPVYNGSLYLSLAVESMLRQTFRDFELIAVDDGSTDDSKKILESFAATDPRVRIISRPNTGLVGALNDAVAAARGEFLARMDADDVSHPERLARQHAFLQAHPACVVVGSAVRVIDPAGKFLKLYAPKLGHGDVLADALSGNGGALMHPSIVIRREAITTLSGYLARFSGYAEDLDLYLRLANVGELANLPEPLLDYRVHHGSYNHTRSAQQRDLVLAAANEARQRRGLPPLAGLSQPLPPRDRVESHVRWAGWALEGNNYGAACSHAWRAFGLKPMERRSRQFLFYVLGRSFTRWKRSRLTANKKIAPGCSS